MSRYPAILVCFFVLCSASPIRASVYSTTPTIVAPVTSRTDFHDLGSAPPTLPVTLVIKLTLRNADTYQRLTAMQNDPTASYYRRAIAPQAFLDSFAPTPATFVALVSQVKSAGLKIGAAAPNRTTLIVTGTVAQIDRLFFTDIHLVNQFGAGYRYANARPALMPPLWRGIVSDITGFDNLVTQAGTPAARSQHRPFTSTPTHVLTWINDDAQSGATNVPNATVQLYSTIAESQLATVAGQAYQHCPNHGASGCFVSQYYDPNSRPDPYDCGVGNQNPDYAFWSLIAPGPNQITEAHIAYHAPPSPPAYSTRLVKPGTSCTGSTNPTFYPQVSNSQVIAAWKSYINGTGLGGASGFDSADFYSEDDSHTTLSVQFGTTSVLELSGDTALQNARGTFHNGMTHADNVTPAQLWLNQMEENQSTYNTAPNIGSQAALASNVFGLQCEDCLESKSGGVWSNTPGQWVFTINSMSRAIYKFGLHAKVREVEVGCTSGVNNCTPASQWFWDRVTYTAIDWLFFEPNLTYSDKQFANGDADALNVYPEDLIYPTNPVWTMAAYSAPARSTNPNGSGCTGDPTTDHGAIDLLITGPTSSCGMTAGGKPIGIYARAFGQVYKNGNLIGGNNQAAAIVNGTGSGYTVPCHPVIGGVTRDFTVYTHRLTVANGPLADPTPAPGGNPGGFYVVGAPSDASISGANFTCGTSVLPTERGWILTP